MSKEMRDAYARWQNSTQQLEIWMKAEARDKEAYYAVLGAQPNAPGRCPDCGFTKVCECKSVPKGCNV